MPPAVRTILNRLRQRVWIEPGIWRDWNAETQFSWLRAAFGGGGGKLGTGSIGGRRTAGVQQRCPSTETRTQLHPGRIAGDGRHLRPRPCGRARAGPGPTSRGGQDPRLRRHRSGRRRKTRLRILQGGLEIRRSGQIPGERRPGRGDGLRPSRPGARHSGAGRLSRSAGPLRQTGDHPFLPPPPGCGSGGREGCDGRRHAAVALQSHGHGLQARPGRRSPGPRHDHRGQAPERSGGIPGHLQLHLRSQDRGQRNHVLVGVPLPGPGAVPDAGAGGRSHGAGGQPESGADSRRRHGFAIAELRERQDGNVPGRVSLEGELRAAESCPGWGAIAWTWCCT